MLARFVADAGRASAPRPEVTQVRRTQ
jgi:hypothetical protein